MKIIVVKKAKLDVPIVVTCCAWFLDCGEPIKK